MSDDKWYFSKETLFNSPSRKSGYEPDRELSCRQQAANFIQDMGQRLQVSQLCINTAIVYMHRFYVFHSFAAFHRNAIAAASLFLAAKVEEQPRKLEHVIKVAHLCLHRENPNLETKSDLYLEQAQDLVFNENVLLQTLGFDVAIDHPHTHVVRCCDLVRASKDLAQTSYFMASNSLHLTTMCLMYKPTVVACFCIHLACKWSSWAIPKSNEGKYWFWYVDKTVTLELLEQLATEFFAIFEKCPTKLKRKLRSMNQNSSPGLPSSLPMGNDGIQFDDLKKLPEHENAKILEGLFPVHLSLQPAASEKPVAAAPAPPIHHQKVIEYKEYKEKRERERLEKERLEKEKHMQGRDRDNIPSHHGQKGGQSISHSRTSSNQMVHKNYPQSHSQPANVHLHNRDNPLLLGRDSSHHTSVSREQTQNFQQTPSSKDYMKHVSQTDSIFVQQYQSNTNVQQSSGYQQMYPHADAKNKNSSLQHQYPSSNSQSYNYNHSHSQRDYTALDGSLHAQNKEGVSGIRDMISHSAQQSHRDKEVVDRKEREKMRAVPSYPYGINPNVPSFKPVQAKPSRDPNIDRKLENDQSRLQKKHEYHHDELQNIEHFNTKNMGDNVGQVNLTKNEFGQMAVNSESTNKKVDVKKEHYPPVKKDNLSKIDVKGDIRIDHKNVPYGSSHKYPTDNKPNITQSSEQKYRLHHMSGKSSDVTLNKHDRQPVTSENYKKTPIDKAQRKPNEEVASRHTDANMKLSTGVKIGDRNISREIINKELSERNKYNVPAQDDKEQKKIKTIASVPPMKHYEQLPTMDHDKIQKHSLKLSINASDDLSKKNVGNVRSFHKQKSHEFGAPGSLSCILPDNNVIGGSKTTSIFSPDSKIPPQNILSALEKDTKSNLQLSPEVSPVKSLNQQLTSTKVVKSSIFSPPLPKNTNQSTPAQRIRTSSSGSSSEPELIPVLTKLEETPGYENIIQEKKIAILPGKVENVSLQETKISKHESEKNSGYTKDSKMLPGIKYENTSNKYSSNDRRNKEYPVDFKMQAHAELPLCKVEPIQCKIEQIGVKEDTFDPNLYTTTNKPNSSTFEETKHLSTSTVNLLGIEKMVDTNITQSKPNIPTYSSFNLISSPPAAPSQISQLSTVTSSAKEGPETSSDVTSVSDHHKKSEKKKKKEKHKHKQKDKDKSERKKEKKKHKDKDKERSEKVKDNKETKIKEQETSLEAPIKITIPKDKLGFSDSTTGLKLKIPKERLKNEDIEEKSSTSGALKIKISKEVIGNYSTHSDHKSTSKKRERSPRTHDNPPSKIHKSSDKRSSSSKSSHGDKNYKQSSHKHGSEH